MQCMNWKILTSMNDKYALRLVVVGFLSGIVFSGFGLVLSNSIDADQHKKSSLLLTPSPIDRIDSVVISNSDDFLDLNLASFDELITLPGIGETKANAIIEFREKYGYFEEINEITYVPGIGNSLFNSIKDLVIINLDKEK